MTAGGVVSLVPSVSETLVAWGIVPAAVTRYCEQPGLVTVGGTKNPDVEAIVGLRPDLVVVDREENRKEDAAALEAAGLRLHVTAVRAIADVAPTLVALGAAVGLPAVEPGSAAVAIDAPGTDRPGIDRPGPAPGEPRPLRVWVPIWRRPWMSINGDTYGSSVLDACGAVNILADHSQRYPTVTIEEVVALAPDVVLAPTEPYSWGERHRPLFSEIAPMVIVDGQDLFWWGVRTPAAIGRIGETLRRIAIDVGVGG
jgi:ABC-type Fe3+-hydroxamate transport system substrate-binding protein